MFRPTGLLGESLGRPAHDDTLRKADDSLRRRTSGWASPTASASGGTTHRRLQRVVALLGIALLFYLPFLKHYPFALIRTDLTNSGSDWSSVLFIVAVFCIIAVGLNVVIGLAGLLDLGYVGFFAIGAYTVALFGSPTSPVTKYAPGTGSTSPTSGRWRGPLSSRSPWR